MMESRRFHELPAGVPEPLRSFVEDLADRYELLERYGAQEAATSIKAVREDLVEVVKGWLDGTVSTTE